MGTPERFEVREVTRAFGGASSPLVTFSLAGHRYRCWPSAGWFESVTQPNGGHVFHAASRTPEWSGDLPALAAREHLADHEAAGLLIDLTRAADATR